MGKLNSHWTGLSYTDVGLVRQLNEDSVLDKSAEQLWAVADGMGGHSAGDYASQTLINELENFKSHALLAVCLKRHDSTVKNINSHLVDMATENGQDAIGCTLASLLIFGNWAICSWSGDSRIYRLRDNKIKMLTRDHSQFCVNEDRNALFTANLRTYQPEALTAAIGSGRNSHIERAWYVLDNDDIFLLCTDGMYKEISDVEIEQSLNVALTDNDAVKVLSDIYYRNGARDNIGLVIVSLKP